MGVDDVSTAASTPNPSPNPSRRGSKHCEPLPSIPHHVESVAKKTAHYRFLAILCEATISRNVIQREAGSYSATARTCGSFPALLEGRLRAQHSVLHLTPYDILVPQFLLTRRPPASSLHRWRCRKCRVVGGSPP